MRFLSSLASPVVMLMIASKTMAIEITTESAGTETVSTESAGNVPAPPKLEVRSEDSDMTGQSTSDPVLVERMTIQIDPSGVSWGPGGNVNANNNGYGTSSTTSTTSTTTWSSSTTAYLVPPVSSTWTTSTSTVPPAPVTTTWQTIITNWVTTGPGSTAQPRVITSTVSTIITPGTQSGPLAQATLGADVCRVDAKVGTPAPVVGGIWVCTVQDFAAGNAASGGNYPCTKLTRDMPPAGFIASTVFYGSTDTYSACGSSRSMSRSATTTTGVPGAGMPSQIYGQPNGPSSVGAGASLTSTNNAANSVPTPSKDDCGYSKCINVPAELNGKIRSFRPDLTSECVFFDQPDCQCNLRDGSGAPLCQTIQQCGMGRMAPANNALRLPLDGNVRSWICRLNRTYVGTDFFRRQARTYNLTVYDVDWAVVGIGAPSADGSGSVQYDQYGNPIPSAASSVLARGPGGVGVWSVLALAGLLATALL